MANIIDGKIISKQVKDELTIKVKEFNDKFNRQITLAVILVGENSASKVYVYVPSSFNCISTPGHAAFLITVLHSR